MGMDYLYRLKGIGRGQEQEMNKLISSKLIQSIIPYLHPSGVERQLSHQGVCVCV